jgi:carboxymethylenebutenolidase
MSGKEITINGKDGSFMGYLSAPASGKGPGVVVIQEIFGVNPWVRSVADWYASQGFMALAPDIFWRMRPGVQLDPTIETQLQEGFGYYQRFNVDKGVEDIQAAIDTLRRTPGCTGKVGNLGFCLGGLLSYLTAARTDTDACASYYGGGINTKLAEVDNIRAPTILHLAGSDSYIPQDAIDAIKAAVKDKPNISVHVYPGMPHAFCRANDPSHYNAEACALAHGRSVELFKSALA